MRTPAAGVQVDLDVGRPLALHAQLLELDVRVVRERRNGLDLGVRGDGELSEGAGCA